MEAITSYKKLSTPQKYIAVGDTIKTDEMNTVSGYYSYTISETGRYR